MLTSSSGISAWTGKSGGLGEERPGRNKYIFLGVILGNRKLGNYSLDETLFEECESFVNECSPESLSKQWSKIVLALDPEQQEPALGLALEFTY